MWIMATIFCGNLSYVSGLHLIIVAVLVMIGNIDILTCDNYNNTYWINTNLYKLMESN